ncbi:hypothetical protein ACWGQ5_11220 [Streptomyces sp. NPDC055722]
MSRVIRVASGTANAQAQTGTTQLHGFSVRENAGTPAVATLVLHDGTTAADPIIAAIKLAASESKHVHLPAIEVSTGIFVERVAGTSELQLYVGG